MGRSFESVRMGVEQLSIRWMRAARAMKKDEQRYAKELAEMARMHSSEAFYSLDDPLEAAVFSILIEMRKEWDELCAHSTLCKGEKPIRPDQDQDRAGTD